MIPGVLGGAGGLARRAGHLARFQIDVEVGLGEPAPVGHRWDLGHHLDALVLDGFSDITIAVGHVTKQRVDVDPVDPLGLLDQRGQFLTSLIRPGEDRTLAVARVAGPHLDSQNELRFLVGEHVEFVAVEAARTPTCDRGASPDPNGDHPIRRHTVTDLQIAVVVDFEVLADHPSQQVRWLRDGGVLVPGDLGQYHPAAATSSCSSALRAVGSCQSMSGLGPMNGSAAARAPVSSPSPAARTILVRNPPINAYVSATAPAPCTGACR